MRSDSLLDGLRVLDLSLWQPGHTATQLLADLGAVVIKVEPPGGDRMRVMADRFANFNGGKRSLVLDLKEAADRDRFLVLVADTEVVVENYRPGVADRLGVGFDALRAVNPSVVMCSITGFGQTGALAASPGHDHNYQAYAGAFSFPQGGGPPSPASLLVGDQGGGLAAAFAILASVLCARATGEPEHIDVSITDLLASWVAPMDAVDPRRPSTIDVNALPGMGVFATADGGYVELGVFTEDHLWNLLCAELGLAHLAGLGMEARSAAAPSIRGELAAAIALEARDPLVQRLAGCGVPVAPIRTRQEMLDDPHFRDRSIIVTGPDGHRMVGHPIAYRVHPAAGIRPAPEIGEFDDST